MNTVSNLTHNVSTLYSGSQASTATAIREEATSTPASDVDAVSLSPSSNGRALLMSRVFRAAADANPPIETVDKPGAFTANFLTGQDREQLTKLYDFASENGIDLAHVDALAWDMAIYRQVNEKSTPGAIYDQEGRRVTYAFSEREAAIADRISAGSAKSNTYLDSGFIREILDPVSMPVHGTNLNFLEKAMEVLSPAGDAGEVDASSKQPGFQAGERWAPSDKTIEKKSEDIQFDHNTQQEVGKGPVIGESRRDVIKRMVEEFLAKKSESSTYETLFSTILKRNDNEETQNGFAVLESSLTSRPKASSSVQLYESIGRSKTP